MHHEKLNGNKSSEWEEKNLNLISTSFSQAIVCFENKYSIIWGINR